MNHSWPHASLRNDRDDRVVIPHEKCHDEILSQHDDVHLLLSLNGYGLGGDYGGGLGRGRHLHDCSQLHALHHAYLSALASH